MNTLIIGGGEIGSALFNILSKQYQVEILDLDPTKNFLFSNSFEILHICLPYSDNFIQNVQEYQKKYQAKYTVIHSTVPRGTSKALGAIHSPIRGKHPQLEEGIMVFRKFLGGERASEVADYFRRAGLTVTIFDDSDTTEALKLFDTQYYLENIRFAQRVKRYCDKHGLNFSEVYTIPNQTYNEGYLKLGMSEVMRPVLQPIMTEVGGHCLIPNERLLDEVD